MNDFRHRPALDGLRTVAVYLVVAFHAGVGWLDGGFVGVDLFFVLSGYLVTNVLLSELGEHGRIRLREFWARRARRLVPAATLAIVGTSAAMVVVASQLDRIGVRDDATAASLWYANWHFLGQSSDYFAENDAPSPFLHFWSLSIEEQFYVAFPILLMVSLVLVRHRQGLLAIVLGALTSGGVAVQLLWADRDPNWAYYGSDARLYQLLAGATLAAVLRTRQPPSFTRSVARWLGLPVLAAVVVVSTSALDVTPSVRGLAATATALAVIAAAELHDSSLVGRALSIGHVTYLGRISYGTYLWHWPVLVVTGRVLELSPLPSLLLSAIVGTALAALSYELVEMPIRRSAVLHRIPRTTLAGGVAAALVAGLVLAPAALTSERRPALAVGDEAEAPLVDAGRAPDIDELREVADEGFEPRTCFGEEAAACIRVAGDGAAVHVVGDSHAQMMLPTFELMAEQHGMQLSATTIPSCPWQLGVVTGADGAERRERCEDEIPDAYDRVIPELDIDIVVVMNLSRDDPAQVAAPLVPIDDDLDDLVGPALYRAATERTVEALAATGRRVVLLEPVPVADFDPLECLSATTEAGRCAFRANADGMNERILRAVDEGSPMADAIDLDGLACPDLPICSPLAGTTIIRRDESHFTRVYARSIADELYDKLVDAGVFAGVDD